MRVELVAQTISFPPQCTCCGKSPNGVKFIASVTQKSTTRRWDFPMCEKCQAHLAIAQSGIGVGSLFIFAMGVIFGLAASWWVFVGGILAATALWHWELAQAQKKAGEALRPSCVTTGDPAKFVGWQGTLQIFEIPSDVYATALLRENSHKAVNLNSEALEALAGTGADLTRQSVR